MRYQRKIVLAMIALAATTFAPSAMAETAGSGRPTAASQPHAPPPPPPPPQSGVQNYWQNLKKELMAPAVNSLVRQRGPASVAGTRG